MATLEENRSIWDRSYEWPAHGDEWSAPWGGPEMQWYGTLLPRILAHVPTGTILEIACGHGRWTRFLKDLCRTLIAVDLSESCVEACRRRFVDAGNIQYHVNDGRSLAMAGDGAVDFVFSFDSLVHAERSVLEAYLSQLPRILSPNGAAFLHHSNLAEYLAARGNRRGVLGHVMRLLDPDIPDRELHWREPGVSAATVAELAGAHGLACISQELVPWGQLAIPIDCMTTLVRADSPKARPNRVFHNPDFMLEADRLRRIAGLYR